MGPLSFTKALVFSLLCSFLLGSSLCVSNAMAGAPTEMVKSTVDQVIKILTDPKYRGDANKEARRKLLRETISPRFDFQEMAKRSLGAEWGPSNSRGAERVCESIYRFSGKGFHTEHRILQ